MCHLSDCRCLNSSSPSIHSDAGWGIPIPKCQDEAVATQRPTESSTDHLTTQYALIHHLTMSVEEVNHTNCLVELITVQSVSRSIGINAPVSGDTEPLVDGMKCESTMLCKPNCCAEAETGSVNNEAIGCSDHEEELVYNATIDNKEMMTHYTEWSTSPEEETGTSTNKGPSLTSIQRSAQLHTKYEKPASRDVWTFVSEDDGISHNESTFGSFSSHRRDVNYNNHSYKSRTFANSELAGAYSETDRPQGNHLMILPHPSSNDGPDKKATVITGNNGFVRILHTI